MRTIITYLILLASIGMHGQKTYLKIHKDNKVENTIMYPPGSKFELRNQHNYIILKYSETPKIQEIDGDYKLIVFPSYKKGKDIYKLTKGAKVELKLTSLFDKSNDNHITYSDGQNITVDKIVSDSRTLKGKKNLIFELSNGIQFEYFDGKYNAHLDNQYLNIKGKYVIESKLGILKINFNPNNGEIWYFFEKAKR